MTCILDPSAAFEIVFRRPFSEKIISVLQNADTVYAPSFYKAEVTNVLWKYVKFGSLSETDAQTLLPILFAYVDDFIDCNENAVESLHEGIRLNHSAYDMFYFTLCRRNNAVLLTMDKKLVMLAKQEGVTLPEG
jgi:predicted nucleic acid-binding protein